ncbi:ATP-binding protein, partial [Spirillospora sp. NPDC029432]|uniref:ATP-binding protein n=1 Tax=Spirillospora sp. NPDC029432 TaxID=3154599 RepID=UPI003456C64E
MEHFLLALAIACSIAGLAAVAYLLVRQRRLTAHLRRRNTALADGLRRRDEELRHLATERLPALLQSLHNPAVTVPGPLHDPHSLGPAYERGVTELMDLFAGSAGEVRARADKAAKLTLRSTMRGVQSLANEQQLAISTMQERHDDPDVLEDLLRLDHMNAQLGRRAQATAVLCGSWPGQQRSASSLSDVVRGATSRIRDYLRVRVQAPVNAAVVSRAVEPVVLTLAELLDNAARHSQPDTSVEVNVQNTHNGVAIIIDDAGVAMDAEELERAGRLLAGSGTADINRLGDPPQIGFAVAGLLADRYGFTVSVDTRSPYGGVRAVVFLPSALITAVPADDRRLYSSASSISPWVTMTKRASYSSRNSSLQN